MSNHLSSVKADQANYLDKTEDEVKSVPSSIRSNTTGTDMEAVEAITAHINKYDVNEEDV
ncbi:hypothetical protein [Paenibacillus sp.]|uniref:hypothetical protein n=1 Tax=Paenibacillus sp. TaxID=58172 RepID=UPI002D55E2D8|nr:hypothetical protein [Paenibacillus sp.]HZG57061.1 hypothetical protein [Paenibacillus sp.]